MANSLGMTISRIKWGYSGKGTRTLSSPLPVGASEVFKDAGGHFVWFDTSRRIEVAGSGNNPDAGAYILGWAECGEFTASSTEGGDTIPVDTSTESQYWMPADAA
ncbi:MAG: hypothetical protein PHD43_24395, partial [Methylococcales bacterium]|nr:hypothetical protein [Methylococcales bacterium]